MLRAALIAVLLLIALLGPASISGASKTCGDLPSRLAYDVTARNVGCAQARRTVRVWGKTAARHQSGDGWVLGLYCNYQSTGYESGAIRCTGSSGRLVRWRTGS